VRRLHWRTAASALAALVLFGCTDWFGESIVGCEPNPRELCRQQNPSPTDRSDAHLGCDEISNGTNWAERLTIYRVDTEALNEVVDPFRGDDSATVEMRRDRARWTLTHPELAPLREAVEPKLENREGKRAVYWYVFENTKAPEDEGPSSGVMGNDESEDNEPFRIEPGDGFWALLVVDEADSVSVEGVRSVELGTDFENRRAELTVEASESFGEALQQFTRRHTGETMAFVYDETFAVAAPVIGEAISDPRFRLLAPFGPVSSRRDLPALEE